MTEPHDAHYNQLARSGFQPLGFEAETRAFTLGASRLPLPLLDLNILDGRIRLMLNRPPEAFRTAMLARGPRGQTEALPALGAYLRSLTDAEQRGLEERAEDVMGQAYDSQYALTTGQTALGSLVKIVEGRVEIVGLHDYAALTADDEAQHGEATTYHMNSQADPGSQVVVLAGLAFIAAEAARAQSPA